MSKYCRQGRVRRLRYATKQEASTAGLRAKGEPMIRRACSLCGGWHLIRK